MKKYFILIITLFTLFSLQGQVMVNEVNINELEEIKYCELLGTNKFLSTKVTVQIDYGQPKKLFKSQNIRTQDGKRMAFNGMIDALNFMEKNGWTYVNSYVVTVGNTNVYHWLLKRKESAE